MDLGPAGPGTVATTRPLPVHLWLQPIHDGRAAPQTDDPAGIAVSRETIRVAFVATLQHLPPRQRAVLILREVLRWKATEVAEQLGASVASVNSALQRARATLSARNLATAESLDTGDEAQQMLLARYVDAFRRFDIESLVAVLHEDATMSVPS
jgi:RNA polymerase sigma-70 factor (ECF subfamily)